MNLPSKSIIYFSDNRPSPHILNMCHVEIAKANLPIVSVTLKPMNFGENIVLPLERGWETYFIQIYTALQASKADIVFFAEHDCLYPQSHFEFTPPTKDKFYYNQNWWKIREDGFAVSWRADQVSGLVCYRELALEWYNNKVESFNKETFDRKFEHGSGTELSESWLSEIPYIDIRQDKAATKNKWSLKDFRDKTTAKDFKESTIDKIHGWNLKVEDIWIK